MTRGRDAPRRSRSTRGSVPDSARLRARARARAARVAEGGCQGEGRAEVGPPGSPTSGAPRSGPNAWERRPAARRSLNPDGFVLSECWRCVCVAARVHTPRGFRGNTSRSSGSWKRLHHSAPSPRCPPLWDPRSSSRFFPTGPPKQRVPGGVPSTLRGPWPPPGLCRGINFFFFFSAFRLGVIMTPKASCHYSAVIIPCFPGLTLCLHTKDLKVILLGLVFFFLV